MDINRNWHLDKAPKLIRLSSDKLEVKLLTLSQSWASQCGGHSLSPQGWVASGLFSSEHWDSGTTRPSGVLQYTCRTIFPCPHGPEHWIPFTKVDNNNKSLLLNKTVNHDHLKNTLKNQNAKKMKIDNASGLCVPAWVPFCEAYRAPHGDCPLAITRWASAVLGWWRLSCLITWPGFIWAPDLTSHKTSAATFCWTLYKKQRRKITDMWYLYKLLSLVLIFLWS